MVIGILRVLAIICVAFVCGKLVSKVRLPSILGWLIAGIVFGPYLAGVVTSDITNALWYKVLIRFFECFAGVMIGREIVFKKIASSGKQIIGITFVLALSGTINLSFVLSQVMTGGGPNGASSVLLQYMYTQGFVNGNFGYAMAITVFTLAISVALSMLSRKLTDASEGGQ